MGGSIEVAQHLGRAARHRKVGDALASAGDEWAAVCYFYAAYHLVRHALRTDPVFDDPTALTAIRADLQPELRDITRHHGRKGGTPREYGINDLVLTLYRPIAGAYEKLHQSSINVRYGEGLVGKPLDRVAEEIDKLWTVHDDGRLNYAALAN